VKIPGIEGRSITRPINNENNTETNTLKCILSNLVFTHQAYNLTCNTIITTFFNHIVKDLEILIKEVILIKLGSGDKYGFDICINNDNKTFNIISNIICVGPELNVENNTIVIGKLTHVIPFNTLEDITSGNLNDSYIIIDTFEDFSTAHKIFDYINKIGASQIAEANLKTLQKKRTLQNSSLFNKLFSKTQTTHQNKLLSSYFNAIPSQNYSKGVNAKKLYKEMSSFILTNNIATIFNFLIHISPYKTFITKKLFNLNEKITYLTNRKNSSETNTRTVDNFDFDTNEKFDVYNGGMDEDAYKMFFCTKKLRYGIDKSLLGEKLFHFFSDQNDKHIFVGFIMNYPKESKPGFFKKVAHDGHMNSFIIDKKNNIIIRFEPKGKESPYFCNITESEFKQYIIDSLNEYKNKPQMIEEEPNQKYALPANINVGELNNNTTSMIDYINNSRNNRDIYNNIPQPPQKKLPIKKTSYQDFLNHYMAQHNNTNTNPTKSNQAHSTSNNEEIKPDNPKKQFIPKFIPKNEINAILHDEYENEYDAMINGYTYIDTSNIKNLNKLTKKSNGKTNGNGNENNYTINNYKAPQKKFFDDYCQTYSLYGALLYCMNIDSIPNFNTERKKAVYTTIKLFEQITQTQEKVMNLQAFIKAKLLIFMPGLINQAIEAQKLKSMPNMHTNTNYGIIEMNNDGIIEMNNDKSFNTIPIKTSYIDINNMKLKTKKNTISNSGDINKIDIAKLDTPKHKQTIEDIFYEFEHKICKNDLAVVEEKDYICKTITTHITNLNKTYNAYLNSQKIFSSTKQNKKSLEQEYYRLLLECDLISQILSFNDKKIKLSEKINMIKYIVDSLANNSSYSIYKFNTIKSYINKLLISPNFNTKQNINSLLKKHGLKTDKKDNKPKGVNTKQNINRLLEMHRLKTVKKPKGFNTK